MPSYSYLINATGGMGILGVEDPREKFCFITCRRRSTPRRRPCTCTVRTPAGEVRFGRPVRGSEPHPDGREVCVCLVRSVTFGWTPCELDESDASLVVQWLTSRVSGKQRQVQSCPDKKQHFLLAALMSGACAPERHGTRMIN